MRDFNWKPLPRYRPMIFLDRDNVTIHHGAWLAAERFKLRRLF